MAKKPKLQEQAVTLRAEGKAYSSIASELGIPVQEAIDITSEESFKVNNLQAVRMETLLLTQRVDRQGRIEQLTDLQTRLREELSRRDLSDIPTDKLITLLLKTSEVIKGEVVKPEILSTKARDKKSLSEWDEWDW